MRGIYKVNLKTRSVKHLYDVDKYQAYINGGVSDLKLHKGYLYYLQSGPMKDSLNRVKNTGSKYKRLASGVSETYAEKNGKIYYDYYNSMSGKTSHKVLKHNGNNKRRAAAGAIWSIRKQKKDTI